ncbi:succinate dehydrogenase cytochrome b subunit [Mycolicibacterium palauense]|uniref:succinate dehydrogenase cytochrome b subunit n=1 Tax=Mycolicibacterium palauense TaxID=2034511 RepID=UPI000BFEEB12|nr:succinate dehydrogenase cytochrome b subunit [Mycolicibacterium palauense]
MTSTVDTADAGHEVTRGPVHRRSWSWWWRPSSVTLKLVMAGTGVVFALFVLVHMIGNLKVYSGAAHFDAYAHWLRTLAEPLLPYEGALWIFRIVLSACLIAHVGAALLLTGRAHRARGRFRRRRLGVGLSPLETLRSYTARTMLVGGVVLLLFIVFHILDLTVGARPAASAAFESGHAYANLVASFSRPAVGAFYLLAMVVLGAHLLHGLYTAVNDLGVTGHRLRQVGVALGGLLALAVMVGNMTIPVAVWTGVLT